MEMTIRKLAAILGASASLIVAPSVAAQTEPRSQRVIYADLDIASSAGVETLHRRIAAAIKRVCDVNERVLPLRVQLEIRKCRVKAKDEADQRVMALLAKRDQLASAR